MKIYVTHSSNFDYKNDLYLPIRQSKLNIQHEITLPHEQTDELFNSKEYMKNCDFILAEVSYPSTGQGIELGWADLYNKPILCFYKKGFKPSKSINAVSKHIFELK